MLRTLSRLPLPPPPQRSVLLTTTTMMMMTMMLVVSHGSTLPLEYARGPSVTDEFARWIVSRIAHQRDIEVRHGAESRP